MTPTSIRFTFSFIELSKPFYVVNARLGLFVSHLYLTCISIAGNSEMSRGFWRVCICKKIRRGKDPNHFPRLFLLNGVRNAIMTPYSLSEVLIQYILQYTLEYTLHVWHYQHRSDPQQYNLVWNLTTYQIIHASFP